MKSYKLSFGTIFILNSNIAEVVVNEGIVMDEAIVDEYHNFLLNHFDAPIGLLVNKKNSYTYNFAAQRTIASLLELKAMAVLTMTSAGVMSTKTLLSINENFNCNIELFQDREEAIKWLNEELA